MGDSDSGFKLTPNFDLNKTLHVAMRVPGVKINREKYLRKAFQKYYSEKEISAAIFKNPAYAGMDIRRINMIADSAITFETNKVTAISAADSVPGGTAMAAAVAIDTTQFFVFVLRIMQKLAYLYGFPEMSLSEDELDDETLNQIMLFLGVMFGVHGANATVIKIANSMANSISTRLARQALTKGVVYPMVKKIARTIGVKMTKQIFADAVGNIIPVAGSVISGGITYISFKPCAKKLQKCFQNTVLSNSGFYEKERISKEKILNQDTYVDVEFSEVFE